MQDSAYQLTCSDRWGYLLPPKDAKAGRIYKDMYVSVMGFFPVPTLVSAFLAHFFSSFRLFSFDCF